MSYQILIKRSAEKELDTLPARIRERIAEHLLALEETPRPFGVKKLRGQEGYRLCVGDYRVLFTIDDAAKTLTIYAVGHRREIYR
jgi:mRNA interferase RelE/StbE